MSVEPMKMKVREAQMENSDEKEAKKQAMRDAMKQARMEALDKQDPERAERMEGYRKAREERKAKEAEEAKDPLGKGLMAIVKDYERKYGYDGTKNSTQEAEDWQAVRDRVKQVLSKSTPERQEEMVRRIMANRRRKEEKKEPEPEKPKAEEKKAEEKKEAAKPVEKKVNLEMKTKVELVKMLREKLASEKKYVPSLDKKPKAEIIAMLEEKKPTKESSDDLFKDAKPDTKEEIKKRTDEVIEHELNKKEMREKKGTAEKPPSMNILPESVRKQVRERLAQDYETHDYHIVGLAHPIQDIIDHIATLQRAETYWGKNYEAVKKYLREVVDYIRDASIPFPKAGTSGIEIIMNKDWEKVF